MSAFTDESRRKGDAAIQECERFFMKEGLVHRSLRAITSRLDQMGVPCAVAGGMALSAHGFERVTADVDILVTPDGLRRLHEGLDGIGYIPSFAGSKNLKDVTTGVRIELTPEFAERLNPFVRPKYLELWQGLQSDQPDVG